MIGATAFAATLKSLGELAAFLAFALAFLAAEIGFYLILPIFNHLVPMRSSAET